MTQPRDDDAVEALLREQPYLDDRGFTDRVMRRLPPAKGRRRWLPYSVVPAATVAAALAGMLLPPVRAAVATVFHNVAATGTASVPSLTALVVGAVLMLTVTSVAHEE